MGFTNRIDKLENDIWYAEKWLADYPEKLKDLEFTKMNTEACLELWKTELEKIKSETGNVPESKGEK